MPKAHRTIFWTIIAVGILVPWLVGIGMKLFLQARGEPTLPWSYFFNTVTLLALVPYTAWIASPFIVFAFLARKMIAAQVFLGMNEPERRFVAFAGLAGGGAASIWTFIGVFRIFDPLYLLLPLPMASLGGICVGLVAGFLLVRGRKAVGGVDVG